MFCSFASQSLLLTRKELVLSLMPSQGNWLTVRSESWSKRTCTEKADITNTWGGLSEVHLLNISPARRVWGALVQHFVWTFQSCLPFFKSFRVSTQLIERPHFQKEGVREKPAITKAGEVKGGSICTDTLLPQTAPQDSRWLPCRCKAVPYGHQTAVFFLSCEECETSVRTYSTNKRTVWKTSIPVCIVHPPFQSQIFSDFSELALLNTTGLIINVNWMSSKYCQSGSQMV